MLFVVAQRSVSNVVASVSLSLLYQVDRKRLVVRSLHFLLPTALPDVSAADLGFFALDPLRLNALLWWIFRFVRENISPPGFTRVVELLLPLRLWDRHTHNFAFRRAAVQNDMTGVLQRGKNKAGPVVGFKS